MDKQRWRYSDTNPVLAAVDSGTVIEIGDLLWQDTDDAKPASDITDQGTEIANQDALVDAFLGVAMQRSQSGDVRLVRVATTGVFEFDCHLDKFELGDLIGVRPLNDAPTSRFTVHKCKNQLHNQVVAKVKSANYAIGRVAKRQASAVTSVLIDIRSKVMGR